MARSIRPDELEKLRKAVTGEAERAAREAAGKALHGAIPFEPTPCDGPADPNAPQHANINFPNSRARLTSDPQKGIGSDIELDVSTVDGKPLDVPEITIGGGTTNGHATLDPRDVPEALKQLSGAEINKTVQFARMVSGDKITKIERA